MKVTAPPLAITATLLAFAPLAYSQTTYSTNNLDLWTITHPTSPSDPTPLTIPAIKQTPVGSWNGSLGRDWIGITNTGADYVPAGEYIYTFTFDASAGPAEFYTQFVVDNFANSISLNGEQLWSQTPPHPQNPPDYTILNTVGFEGTLLTGTNTLSYVTTNRFATGGAVDGSNPAGFSGYVTVTPVPEPSSALLLGLSGSLAFLRRRRTI